MELLRGTAPKVRFYPPTPDTTDVVPNVLVNGVSVSVGAPVEQTPTNEDSFWELQLPYLGADTNDVEVTWNFKIGVLTDTFTEVASYEAVSPYLTKQELKAIFNGTPATDDEMWNVESAVRHIINAHTGQKFDFDQNKTLTVEGHGDGALRLPERLVVLRGLGTLTSNLDTRAAIITGDGWYLKKAWANELSPKTSSGLYWGDYNSGPFDNNIYSDPDGDGDLPIVGPLGSRPGGVITAPGTSGRATPWKDDYPFEITGDWGYKSVPAPVKEAAKLLVNDYACKEIAYRDRYLESIKASDWRLQYNSRAWESTGNVRADQLLSEFILMDWAVI